LHSTTTLFIEWFNRIAAGSRVLAPRRCVLSRSAAAGGSFGKLWTVAKMQNLQVTTQHFTPDDPDYNPDDSAMAEIHCRVQRARVR
jgi:hypothetical protein